MPWRLSEPFYRFAFSPLMVSGMLLFEIISPAESKPFEQVVPEEATNLNLSEPRGKEHTNTPSGILENSDGSLNQAEQDKFLLPCGASSPAGFQPHPSASPVVVSRRVPVLIGFHRLDKLHLRLALSTASLIQSLCAYGGIGRHATLRW
jgi:hypothetical protein